MTDLAVRHITPTTREITKFLRDKILTPYLSMNQKERESIVLLLMSHLSIKVGLVKYSIAPGGEGVGMTANKCEEDIFLNSDYSVEDK